MALSRLKCITHAMKNLSLLSHPDLRIKEIQYFEQADWTEFYTTEKTEDKCNILMEKYNETCANHSGQFKNSCKQKFCRITGVAG
ncbi:hypothetical protein E2C01_005596 [Portunus trituberculatus]|uniref:Uncharacterized protein n=1 Tax=Portunus trituberculatus TaxID=210409 RepID=A0A5B7CVI5_PORTR|nr:hypothetical protein [Portunus trituberculatus]